MSAHLPLIENLLQEFSRMPGIGRKAAERLAYHVLAMPLARARDLAEAISSVRKNVRICKICFSLAEEETCPFCCDARREGSLICVVARARDVIQIEKTGTYKGLYHVLQGHIAPLEGIGPEKLRINELLGRLDGPAGEACRTPDGKVEEVILAMNPTAEGETTLNHLADRLKGRPVRVTLPARGIPQGAEIEFTDAGILSAAMQHRVDLPAQGSD